MDLFRELLEAAFDVVAGAVPGEIKHRVMIWGSEHTFNKEEVISHRTTKWLDVDLTL
jgi:hypothetical protein